MIKLSALLLKNFTANADTDIFLTSGVGFTLCFHALSYMPLGSSRFPPWGGSLFFSEILKIPPCELCWWQRIFIYPLALLMPVGIIKEDKNIRIYAVVLLIPGLLISIYHNLLYYGVIEEPLTPCRAGVSCTSRDFEFFGFLGIPLMSLVAFIAMLTLVALTFKKEKKK